MTEAHARDLEKDLATLAARHPTIGLAVAAVRAGGPARIVTLGLADTATRRPVTPRTVVRIASITKTFTGIAILQLCERGLIDLDDPAERHLRSLGIDAGTHAPPTIRHLLTHTAGLGELARPWGALRPDFGESVPADRPLPSLDELYGGRVRIHAEPGTRFVYTNHGPAILGQIVEDVTGRTLDDYLTEHVFGPLDMTETTVRRTPRVRAALATGYEVGSRGVRTVAERDMMTTGAASAYSTPEDMARYAAALLAEGRGPGGRILTPESLALMFSPQYRPDSRLPGMGLAFFRHTVGGVEVVGHQGTHPGFHSQLLLAPGHGVAVLAFTNGAAEPDFWLPSATSGLLASELGVDAPRIRDDVPLHPEVWHRLTGWYSLPARLSDTRLRGLVGLGAEVFVAGGALRLRFLTPIPQLFRGFVLRPDDPADPTVFRADLGLDDMDPMRFAFAGGPDRASALVLDAMPVALHRQPDATNPRRWVSAALAGGAVAACARTAGHRPAHDRRRGSRR